MAGHPLRPATRRSLGRPLPHQQADRPRAHPPPKKLSTQSSCEPVSYHVLATVSGGYPCVKGRLLTCYSPVRRSSTPKRAFPLDLHVLSTPPAFVLSQDQTLQQKPKNGSQSQQQTTICCQKKPHRHKNTGQGKQFGTGLSSTLLSSQRTTTHPQQTATNDDPPQGHSFNFTRSSRPCQPVSPGSCRSSLAHPSLQARGALHKGSIATIPRFEGFGRTAGSRSP